MKSFVSLSCFLLILLVSAYSEDGYRLWLRYDKVTNAALLSGYRSGISGFNIDGSGPSMLAAAKELEAGLKGLLDKSIPSTDGSATGSVIVTLNKQHTATRGITYDKLGNEGYVVKSVNSNGKKFTVITANTDKGALYGVYAFLRLIQTHKSISNLSIISVPKIDLRILNHWDNLNRTVERGYAGISIWNWHTLPTYIDQRYIDYARANASIGINGTVLTNVNANALILDKSYLQKVAALATTFRPYGIKVYLTARFSAPIEAGGLKTADPLDPGVIAWWQQKTKEIYDSIPDFGGFLVKANSEGQPGPQNYNRSHAEGANLLADAVAPFGGIVIWRAFVYSNEVPDDRVKQAYSEFKPLDGRFRKNVMVQVKNGPLDFQPREPFHPLFGAMPGTPLVMEFQLTQEYLGQGTHLVYQGPLYKEVLDADTYTNGKGTTVAKLTDNSSDQFQLNAIAGVANIGNDRNWTGHPFGQANWYAFGKLAWDHETDAMAIAEEWTRQTFSNDASVVADVTKMMQVSREAVVNYMTPLGLHHIMATNHHYGPGPWVSNAGRMDWNPVYYHKADSAGIGFNRSSTGSNAISQYHPEVQKQFSTPSNTPDTYLLWFHHVPWDYKVKSGRTLWEELCYKYNLGVDSVKWMQTNWQKQSGKVDPERFRQVNMLLDIQLHDAKWWRDACLSYFSTFSGKPIPAKYEQPAHPLEYYKKLNYRYAPGIGGNN